MKTDTTTTPHISAVQLRDFNKQTRTHQLAPGVNLIIGPNGVGKSSIWQAIEFTATGKITGLPKKNGAIMRACGHKVEMETRLIAALPPRGDVVEMWRRLRREQKNGKTSYAGKNGGIPKGGDIIPPACLDLSAFTNADSRTQAAMIMQAAGADLGELLQGALNTSGLGQLIDTAQDDEMSVADWLEALSERAKDLISSLNTQISDMKGTLRGMESLEADPPVYHGPSVAEIDAAIREAEQTIARAQGSITALESRPAPVAPLDPRPAAGVEFIEGKLPANRQAIHEAEKNLAAAITKEARLTQAAEAHAATHKAKVLALAQAREALAGIPEARPGPEVEGALSAARNILEQAEAVLKVAEGEDNPLFENNCCPVCAAKKEHWGITRAERASEEVITARRDVVISCQDRVTELEEELAYARATAATEAKIATLERDIAELDVSPPPELPAIPDSIALREAVEALYSERVAIESALAAARAWASYDRESEVYGKTPEAIQAAKDSIATAEANLTKLTPARELAQANADALAQIKARETTRTQAREKLEYTEGKLAEVAAASAGFAKLVKDGMAAALGPVIATCEVFGRDLFPGPLMVDNLEIGYWDGLTWTPFAAMNASNKRITTAAIQAALAARAGGIKIVCLDEFGIVDDTRKMQVLENLDTACQRGLLHQILVMDNRLPGAGDMLFLKDSGVNVITL